MVKQKERRDYSKTDLAQKIKNEYEKKNNFKRDERFWVLSRDASGNGLATIRFLPNKDINELPFIGNFKHSFKLPGKKNSFVEKCPTTVGKECPICEWNTTQDKEWVKKNYTYRRKSWIQNILVLNDPANPENNGKVFLFEFGQQVYSKLKEALTPETVDSDGKPLPAEEIEDPLWYFFTTDEGANFKVKVTKEKEFPSWIPSKFLEKSSLEDELKKRNITISVEDILDSCYDLKEVIDTASYKESSEIKKKLDAYLGGDSTPANDNDDNDENYASKKKEAVKKETPAKKNPPKDEDEETPPPAKKPVVKDEDEEAPAAPKKTEKKASTATEKAESLKKTTNYFAEFSDDDNG